jgi:hypothetical protein
LPLPADTPLTITGLDVEVIRATSPVPEFREKHSFRYNNYGKSAVGFSLMWSVAGKDCFLAGYRQGEGIV